MKRSFRIFVISLPTLLVVAFLVFRTLERKYWYTRPANITNSDDLLTFSEKVDLWAMAFWSLPAAILALAIYLRKRSASTLLLSLALAWQFAVGWLIRLFSTSDNLNASVGTILYFWIPFAMAGTGLVIHLLDRQKA